MIRLFFKQNKTCLYLWVLVFFYRDIKHTHIYMYAYVCAYACMKWKQKGYGARKKTRRERKGERRPRGGMRDMNIVNVHDIFERN